MNLLTIAYFELKRLFRDHRLVLIVLSQPIVIALFVGLISFQDPKDIKIGLIRNDNNYSKVFENELKKSDKLLISNIDIIDINDVQTGKYRAIINADINQDSGRVEIINDPTANIVKITVEAETAKALSEVSKQIVIDNIQIKIGQLENNINNFISPQLMSQIPKIRIDQKQIEPVRIETKDATTFKLKHFDYFASAMMVLLVLLVVLNLSGISITNERIHGTFERLFVTPYSKIDVILGKALAQFFIGLVVVVLGTGTLYLIFGISIGNIYLLSLIDILVVASAVTLGLLISSITYTVVESVELAMYLFFISVLTTAILSPLETVYKYFVYFIKITPFYYAVDASRKVNMAGVGWSVISIDIYVLIGFFIGFLFLSILLLRREAK